MTEPRYCKIEVTFTMLQKWRGITSPVPEDEAWRQAEFFFEEHLCVDNLIDSLKAAHDRLNPNPNSLAGICSSCDRAKVKLLGWATLEDLEKFSQDVEEPGC